MSEQDIRSKYITPAIVASGWDLQSQISEEVTFTAGRIIVRGKLVSRGKAKRADYILYHKPNIPIAVIEAKDNKHPVGGYMFDFVFIYFPFLISGSGGSRAQHIRHITDAVKAAPNTVSTPLPMACRRAA
jgi:type I restriction enzyme, R subunit